MSQHRSLRGSGKITTKRNVLKRFERVDLLQKRGEWKEGSRGLGLRKTKPEGSRTISPQTSHRPARGGGSVFERSLRHADFQRHRICWRQRPRHRPF